ncbi:hypothetical protein MNEG_3319 [Monoraphidium neglectum]|uniref:U-box domain-containing protein n=1 Tax=Monoraphidium neglectum TaxID=145388 RepID=A0A0D2K253_9CHLO|nr:hypothetical protein MNEG_3319 [Monoraphidium neglectum]KIZ04638.1 hypothetical protein MNEG_3319 [Monoraphidium neglectum]|eukprot:XP_013903657.1 hypothetical protein MNEG_3319 [Monoraphidium neglectum]
MMIAISAGSTEDARALLEVRRAPYSSMMVQMQHFTAAPIVSLQCCSGVIAALPLPAMRAGQLLASAEANPSLIYVHSKDGLNVWHLAAQSGDPQVVNMVAAAVSEVLSHQKKQDKMLAQVNAGFNTVNLAVNHIAAATTAAIPSQIAIPMGRNIDKDAQTREGKTALMVAVQGGHSAAVAALLSCGVDAWRGEIRGNTALHMAVWQGDIACVKLLLAHADNEESPDLPDARRLVNSVNLTGLTPAHFACWRGHGGVLRDLVNAGAYLAAGASGDSMGDVSCNKGSTPLHLAAMKGDVTIIRLLLKAHAKLLELTAGSDHRLRDPRRIPDGYGKTAYTIAFDLGRSEAAEVLDPTVALQEAVNRATINACPKKARGSAGAGAAAAAAALGRRAKKPAGDGPHGGSASPERRAGWIKAAWEQEAVAVAAGPAHTVPAAAQAPGSDAKAGPWLPALASPPRAVAVGAAEVPALAPPPRQKQAHAQQSVAAVEQTAGKPLPPQQRQQQQQQQQQRDEEGLQRAAARLQGHTQAQEQQPNEPEQQQELQSSQKQAQQPASERTAAVLSASEHGQGAATPQPPQAAEVPVPALALAAPAEAAPAPPATAQEPPEDLVCPITGELFLDPVRASDGRCYEREAIETWLMLGNTSFPGGRARIASRKLTADDDTRRRVGEWRAAH